jgi:hypothetical protein
MERRMKVFDVTFRDDLCANRPPIAIFAEDAAQATRIAVWTVNKLRQANDHEVVSNSISYSSSYIQFKPLEDLTAEEVVKVEVVRDRVAS